MSLKAMKWAIEVFLDRYSTADQVAEVIGALRKAIEQAEKPCQTGSQCIGGKCPECEREWVGLTDKEARKFYEKYTNREELIYAIDKFLEEKNT